ncbi:hypothetical protein [Aeoliella mucimassa]|uniref:PEP-CTERM protein-sorting domain-containing protein n=1 Tax=Aeoliella mucimassa TaxID=2527972 RepID=A0A518AR71_9BACT|nr:hypothetical protein [Aeoliella mucimassa]QDU57205.1 hypothetical protein Pan181_34190 [Aeoliella mucimassa]
MKKLVFAFSCVAVLAAASVGSAALVVTNGDFETGGGENLENVTDWSDYNTGNFWEGAWQTNADWISPNGTNVAMFSSFESDDFGTPTNDVNDGSYLYQSFGTADGAASVDIQFDWGAPNDDPGGRELGMTVGIYAYDGSTGFTPGDGSDVRGATGVTMLDSASYTLSSTGVDGLVVTERTTLSLAGAGTQELFLRFNGYIPGTTEAWPMLDNVSIVPEPASVLMCVLGGIAVLAWRRK